MNRYNKIAVLIFSVSGLFVGTDAFAQCTKEMWDARIRNEIIPGFKYSQWSAWEKIDADNNLWYREKLSNSLLGPPCVLGADRRAYVYELKNESQRVLKVRDDVCYPKAGEPKQSCSLSLGPQTITLISNGIIKCSSPLSDPDHCNPVVLEFSTFKPSYILYTPKDALHSHSQVIKVQREGVSEGGTVSTAQGTSTTAAAKGGDSNAQFQLGMKYELGNGVPKDKQLAMFWYAKAAAQGSAEAQEALKRIAPPRSGR